MTVRSALLEEVVDFYAGSSLSEGEDWQGQEGGYLLTRVSDMNRSGNEKYILTTQQWSATPRQKSATCPGGAVVIPKRGGAIGTNKKRIVQRAAVLDPNLMAMKPHQDVLDLNYLYQWFLAVDLGKLVSGSSVPQLNKKDLAPLLIPLPPLAEQKRISAVLDQVDTLRVKRREAIVLLDDLAQSIFLDMFGDPATNPKNVPVVKISDIAKVGTGATPRRDDRSNYGGRIPWVKTGEVSGGVIRKTEESISESALSGSNCRIYPAGSIVVAMYGQGKTRGQCARLGVPAATNQACAVLQSGSRVDGEFLFRQLLLSYDRLRGLGRGGNQENLNLALVRGFPVLLPHLDEQREYVRVITEVEAVRERYVAHLAILDELFTSLQHRAFIGTLWNHEASGGVA
ncbi:restriction endonuclease subunit S [Streptomyces sp. 900105755]